MNTSRSSDGALIVIRFKFQYPAVSSDKVSTGVVDVILPCWSFKLPISTLREANTEIRIVKIAWEWELTGLSYYLYIH